MMRKPKKKEKKEKSFSLFKKFLKKIRTRVECIQCPNCQDIIYSRTRHDFHYCTCGDVFIDGGFDYLRCGWTKNKPKDLIKYVNASKEMLYHDWNNGWNEYGNIGKPKWKNPGKLPKQD